MEAREEFAARRRRAQDDYLERIMPIVKEALSSRDFTDLLKEAEAIYADTYTADTDGPVPPAKFLKALRDSLEKSTPKSSAEATALMVIVSAMNSATLAVADHEGVFLEWVTMHDSEVRAAHVEADGQIQPLGESFDVGGVKMAYPGDTSAPIELWINCRCVLRPTADEFRAGPGGVTYGDVQTLGGTMDPEDTQEPVTEEPISAADAAPVPWHGVLAPEGILSGDGRMFSEGSLRNRDLPLPLTWQKTSAEGHDQNVTVAKIEKLQKIDGMVHASGHFLSIPEADEAIGLIAEFGRYGVSIDADEAVAEMSDEGVLSFSDARISAACIVSIPAFAEAYVSLGYHPVLDADLVAAIQAATDVPEDAICAHGDCEAVPTMLADSDTANWSVMYCAEHAEQHDGDTLPMDIPELIASVQAKRGPGWVTNPEDTRRLHRYWTQPGQPGYAKIAWGSPGDFNRCRVLVGEKIATNSPEDTRFLNQICAQWHHDALGIWPGEHAAREKASLGGEIAPSIQLVASGGWCAPSEWFKDPEFTKETALDIVEEEAGWHVFGHLAQWGECHIGLGGACIEAPSSPSDYAYFLLGQVDTDEGPVRVGGLTIGTGHAALRLGARPAAAHYDNTGSVWADVAIGEDAFGIWVNGWVRPGVDEETIYAAKASGQISGDWRKINGELELVAALSVNVPGFPVPRPALGMVAGAQESLVAAGLLNSDPVGEAKIKVKLGLSDTDKVEIAKAFADEMEARAKRKDRIAALRQKVSN